MKPCPLIKGSIIIATAIIAAVRTAWVSIGGNDFFLTGCSAAPATLSAIQANIQKAGWNIVESPG